MGLVTPWPHERLELLRQLWSAGFSGGEIAQRLGITRGMVAGMRHNLGLPPRDPYAQYVAMAANGRRTAQVRGHKGKASPEMDREKRREVEAMERMTAPLKGSNPLPWQFRRPGQCTFPVQGYGAEMLSCCEPVEPGGSYCLGHTEIVAGRPWPPVEPANLDVGEPDEVRALSGG